MYRRDFIRTGTAALASATLPSMASADALHQLGGAQRIKVGQTVITALSDGHVDLINADTLVGIDEDGYEAALRKAGRGAGARQSDINAYLVDDGHNRVLIDAGGSKSFVPTLGGVPDALRFAGYRPEDITHILMSHLHPDHVSGALDDHNGARYPNAELIVHAREYEFWITSSARSQSPQMEPFFRIAHSVIQAYNDRIRIFDKADVGIGGITAEPLFGHTPGHVGYVIENGGEHVLVTSDLVLHSVIQLSHPDVSVAFDIDPQAATAVRQRMLERVAFSRERLVGMHFPFPGIGRIERSGSAYRWVAEERHFF